MQAMTQGYVDIFMALRAEGYPSVITRGIARGIAQARGVTTLFPTSAGPDESTIGLAQVARYLFDHGARV